jgi:hypothetical protein
MAVTLAYNLSRDDLLEQLREQVAFLERSAASFDQGFQDEAKRLATVIRVLVHDTSASLSVLGQLGEKAKLQFLDTAATISPENLVGTPGLVMFHVSASQSHGDVQYDPRLELSWRRDAKAFDAWWTDPVTKTPSGSLFSRCDYVDPSLDADWAALTRQNALAFVKFGPEGEQDMGSPALPTVRQIAYEVDETIRGQLSHFLRPNQLKVRLRRPCERGWTRRDKDACPLAGMQSLVNDPGALPETHPADEILGPRDKVVSANGLKGRLKPL